MITHDKKTYTHYEKKINISNSDEVRNWCKILGCSKEELREAINAVGDSVKAVIEYFS